MVNFEDNHFIVGAYEIRWFTTFIPHFTHFFSQTVGVDENRNYETIDFMGIVHYPWDLTEKQRDNFVGTILLPG